MNIAFMWETLLQLIGALPTTIGLAALSIALGAVLALLLALCRASGTIWLDLPARLYIFVFRGSPLLVQIFLIYYGLGQFPAVRHSFLWPILREPYWCAVLALTMNTAAYGGEIIRGGLLSVPQGQMDAARACGMSRLLAFRRIALPLAIRQALPGYGNEMISMIKATSLASIITIMELTGVAAKIISDTYRPTEVFLVAGALYLALNFVLTQAVALAEFRLNGHTRMPGPMRSPDIGDRT